MEDEQQTEKDLLIHYTRKGYNYNEIIIALENIHGKKYSYRTLRRRISDYGLSARSFDFDSALRRIQELLTGPDSESGYRMIWQKLLLEGIKVPRSFVQTTLQELNPEGSERRKGRRLKRRVYRCRGPNFAWHLDGYDKLKPHGFPIHGAIDGYSRKIIWLYVTRSNNSPDRILNFYMRAVRDLNGFPTELITDLGTENGIVASVHSYFRGTSVAHRYVSSPRNQRIESWWSQYSKQRSKWWRDFFSQLETEPFVDLTNELHKEALWFTFAPLIQDVLDTMKEQWNSHYIRRSRYDTVAGKPDLLYTAPQQYGGVECAQAISESEFSYIATEIEVPADDENEYTEYFQYVVDQYPLVRPSNTDEAVEFFKTLIELADRSS